MLADGRQKWRVSNQLISLASREPNEQGLWLYWKQWQVSNQLISLASREFCLFICVNIKREKTSFQSINFPSE